jgi:cap2 methyltransferase
MQVYDITHKHKLPPVSQWFLPNFSGIGDAYFSAYIKEPYSNPKNWKKDFPNYDYQIPKCQQLKHKLNESKKQLDSIYADKQQWKIYDRLTDVVRLHEDLRTPTGVIAKKYKAEIVTNAWLKMYELCTLLDPIFKKYEPAKNSKDQKVFHSFHIAEAPGTFLLAMNHYIANHFPLMDWKWLANTYRDLYSAGLGQYLKDEYGLIEKFKNQWEFGACGDGDITAPENLRAFKLAIDKKLGSLQFITSDVKFVPPEINFDEEENINIPVHMGHLLCALLCLEKGGTMILKEFTYFETPSICLLFLAAALFDQLLLIKPETSRPANSEIYIVGFGYHKEKFSDVMSEHLLKVLGYIRNLAKLTGSPSLFAKDDLPTDYVKRIEEVMTNVSSREIVQINRNIELFKKYGSNISKAQDDLRKEKYATAEKWIERVKIQPLSAEKKMKN